MANTKIKLITFFVAEDGETVVVVQSLSHVQLLLPPGLQPARLLCPWDSPGKNTGVRCHFLLQGIFPTQESNPGLLHCRQVLYQLSYEGQSPQMVFIMLSAKFSISPRVSRLYSPNDRNTANWQFIPGTLPSGLFIHSFIYLYPTWKVQISGHNSRVQEMSHFFISLNQI